MPYLANPPLPKKINIHGTSTGDFPQISLLLQVSVFLLQLLILKGRLIYLFERGPPSVNGGIVVCPASDRGVQP